MKILLFILFILSCSTTSNLVQEVEINISINKAIIIAKDYLVKENLVKKVFIDKVSVLEGNNDPYWVVIFIKKLENEVLVSHPNSLAVKVHKTTGKTSFYPLK